jgi:hypothetical protein
MLNVGLQEMVQHGQQEMHVNMKIMEVDHVVVMELYRLIYEKNVMGQLDVIHLVIQINVH